MEEFFTLIKHLDYPLVIVLLFYYSYQSFKADRIEISHLQKEIKELHENLSAFKSSIIKDLLSQAKHTTTEITKLAEKIKLKQ